MKPALRNEKPEGIGARVLRKEDQRFVTGSGRYVDDIAMPNMLRAVVVRSPVAHGRLIKVDAGEALRANPHAICLDATQFDDLPPIPVRIGASPELEPYVQRPLAVDTVRFVGEPVAVVLAASQEEAYDAADRVHVEIEELPPVVDIPAALAGNSPQVHAGFENVAASWEVSKGSVDEALRRAPVVLEQTFELGRHSGIPMEPRGLLAYYDNARDLLQVWGPTKLPYINRIILGQMLGRAEEAIQFIEPDVGGSFGVRGEFYPEDFLIPCLALRLGRPVKWTETRQEHMVSINHSREQRWNIRLAAEEDGRLIALDAELVNDMGAYIRTHGTIVPHHSCTSLPGPYYLDHYRCTARCTITNRTPTGTMRAPGMFEATFARERAMDMLADRLGLAPEEIRARNLIRADQMPYEIYPGAHGPYRPAYDGGDFPRLYRDVLAACDYAGWRGRVDGQKGKSRVAVGLGMAAAVEPSGLGPFERAKLRLDMQGRINVFVGATSQGQSLETTLAQVCSEVFDLPIAEIVVRHGDTAMLNIGYGTNASRTAVMAGSAVYKGALELKEKIVEAAAAYLDCGKDQIVYESGRLYNMASAGQVVGLAELAKASSPFAAFLKSKPLQANFSGNGIEVDSHVSNVPEGTCVFSLHLAQVSVDLETGRISVDRYFVGCDVGRVLNPVVVDGQIVGGVAQGIGGALMERFVYDDNGQPLAASFMDYAMPLASSFPMIETLVLERTRAQSNPLGVKGVGEVGTSGAGGAIGNAVADALGGLGTGVRALPITPLALFQICNPAAN